MAEGRLDPREFGGGEGKLTPEDIDGDAAILIITEAKQVDFGESIGLKIYSEQSPEVPFIVSSKGDVETLISRLGDRMSKWEGQQLPIEVATRVFGKKEFVKLVVVPEADWDDMLAPPKRRAPSRRTAKKAAKKPKAAKRRGR
ncbi:MAG: hypothetical protein GY906_22915 [bacterium]|nr:hypothetical protein [bacterium]